METAPRNCRFLSLVVVELFLSKFRKKEKEKPVLPFLGCSVLPRKNSKITKDFLSLPNAQKPWKNMRKHPFYFRKFLAQNQPRKSKQSRKRKDREASCP